MNIKQKINISKEFVQGLSHRPFKLMFDIIQNDLFSFSIIRPQIGRGE